MSEAWQPLQRWPSTELSTSLLSFDLEFERCPFAPFTARRLTARPSRPSLPAGRVGRVKGSVVGMVYIQLGMTVGIIMFGLIVCFFERSFVRTDHTPTHPF